MRARRTSGRRPPGSPDRALWQRSRETEASPDESERFLDLAGFIDRRLDEDEQARIAGLIASDPAAAADVAAARALFALPMPSVSERTIERAIALVDPARPRGLVVSFPPRPSPHRLWRGAANWSGLAAAIMIAGWLGFDLGSSMLPMATPAGRTFEDGASNEIFDLAPSPSRDFSDGWQT